MTVNEIRNRYSIETKDIDEIKGILKRKLKENHPDNGGRVDSGYFSKLKEDLDFIEEQGNSTEVTISANELMKLVSELMQTQTKNDINRVETLNLKFDESVTKQIEHNKRRWKTSRYSSAGILALFTFLWTFPNQVMEHPFIQYYMGSIEFELTYIPLITRIWFLCLFFTILIWMYTYYMERCEQKILEEIKREEIQNEIFMSFSMEYITIKKFYKSDFTKYLRTLFYNRKKRRRIINGLHWTYYDFSEELIQSISEIILERAKEVGVIKNVRANNLIERFEFVREEE